MDTYSQLHRASQLMDLKRYDSAREIIQQALESDFENEYAFQLLGRCELYLKNYKAAENALLHCLNINPQDSYAHYLLSFVYYKVEKYNKAASTICTALEIIPDNADYLAQMARTEIALGQYTAAQKTLAAGLKIDPNNVGLLQIKANAHYIKQENADGLQAILEGLKNDPTNDDLLTTLGYAKMNQTNYDQAKDAFIQALQNDPNNERARQGLAETYKVRWGLFRTFYHYGFSRWQMEWTWWKIVLIIFLFKTMILWGGLFAGFLLFAWWGDVFFNSCLRLGEKTKYLLSKQKTVQSNYFLAINGVALTVAILAALLEIEILWKVFIVIVVAIFIGIAYFEVPLKSQRRSILATGIIITGMLLFGMGGSLSSFLFLGAFLLILFGLLFSFRIIGW